MRYFRTDSVYTIYYFASNNACINTYINRYWKGKYKYQDIITNHLSHTFLYIVYEIYKKVKSFAYVWDDLSNVFFAKQLIFFSWKLAVNDFCDACYISKYLFCVPYCFKCICWSMYVFMYWCAYMCVFMCVYI